jgi:hypothetical protein
MSFPTSTCLNRIATMILAEHWIADTEEQFSTILTDAEVFARGIERLLVVLRREHVRVFVLDDVPDNILSVPYELASARWLKRDRELGMTQTSYAAQQRSVHAISRQYGLRILRPQDVLCARGRCAIARGDASLIC